MKGNGRMWVCAAVLLTVFVLWTVLLCHVDVRAIGPQGSSVGFARLNGCVHRLTGVHFRLYTITDWLGLVPMGVGMGFAMLGLLQWIRRRSIVRVDGNVLTLGVFYIVVMAVYLFFESTVINYRPVLIDGYLEVSYPSSTTMLVLCVMPTAVMQFNARIRSILLRRGIAAAVAAFVVFMVVGRLISGVHWLTDIIGGGLLSAGLVALYAAVSGLKLRLR